MPIGQYIAVREIFRITGFYVLVLRGDESRSEIFFGCSLDELRTLLVDFVLLLTLPNLPLQPFIEGHIILQILLRSAPFLPISLFLPLCFVHFSQLLSFQLLKFCLMIQFFIEFVAISVSFFFLPSNLAPQRSIRR